MTSAGTFRSLAEACALAWKASSATLPDAAREEGLYRETGGPLAICLPAGYANYNLLPDARQAGLEAFEAAGIPWHHGTANSSGNHLLSSQVQCVNALAPMIAAPDAVQAAFGDMLDIAEVLPFGDPTSPDACVAFEWVGLSDYLNEHPNGPGTRGANNTSADAAIRYRTTGGATEIALIEWKYTETYSGQELSGGDKSKAVRIGRYKALFEDPDSPIRVDLLDLDDFLVEPVYQLLRLQLLAWRMENARELGADRVRLVYAAPSANTELWSSVHRPAHLALASDLGALWSQVLRRPDRFVLLDTARLVSPEAPTSDEFRVRYGHLVVGHAPTPQPSTAGRDEIEHRVRTAVEWARTVFLRLADSGGVLDQVLALESFDGVPLPLLEGLASRAEEVSRLAQSLRGDEIFDVLSVEAGRQTTE